MATPDLTVILVSWNTRDDLLRCLASIDAETRDATLQVVVVDNASADGTLEAVSGRHPGVECVDAGENLGFAGGNNRGLDRARGRHTLLLNPDTVIVDGGLDRLVRFLDEHPDVACVGCRLEDDRGTIERSIGRFPSPATFLRRALGGDPDPDPARVEEPLDVDWVTGAFLALRGDLVRDGLRLDPGYPLYFEDVDLCRQIRERGGRVVFVPERWALHLRGRAPLRASRRRLRRLGERRYHRKFGGVSGTVMALVYAVLAGRSPQGTVLPDRPDG